MGTQGNILNLHFTIFFYFVAIRESKTFNLSQYKCLYFFSGFEAREPKTDQLVVSGTF